MVLFRMIELGTLTGGMATARRLIGRWSVVDEGKAADVTILDLGKAFDTVLYGTLLDGLSYCETNEFILCWVMN